MSSEYDQNMIPQQSYHVLRQPLYELMKDLENLLSQGHLKVFIPKPPRITPTHRNRRDETAMFSIYSHKSTRATILQSSIPKIRGHVVSPRNRRDKNGYL